VFDVIKYCWYSLRGAFRQPLEKEILLKNLPLLLQFLCLRHGQTQYTGAFPDLTGEGIAHMKKVGKTIIRPWIRTRQALSGRLQVISSTAVRALGSAHTAMVHINWRQGVDLVEEIGPMAWRDEALCQQALKGLVGRGYIDYETEPVFADASLFETPTEMRQRSFKFFADYVRDRWVLIRCCILFSHYEFLCPWTNELFGIVPSEETALKHGEHFELSFYQVNDSTMLIRGTFRGEKKEALFDTDWLTVTPIN